jgi:NAD(P)-dependent dehydrogenase (short-subunit alcohol dehydrogenase family)
MKLSKKKALVTGAAKRVGRQIALALAQKGADILLHYHTSEDEAKKTALEIKAFGVHCELVKADLSDSKQLTDLADRAANQHSVDILVNSASIFYPTPLSEVTLDHWDAFMSANLKAPFVLSAEIGKKMAQGPGGKIINIADWSGSRPYKDYLPYCVSKGGLITLTKALARDLAPKVQVNAVAPGPVLLPENFTQEEKEKAVKKTLLGRTGSPQDVASAVVFLAESDFINGIVLTVDGGRSIN